MTQRYATQNLRALAAQLVYEVIEQQSSLATCLSSAIEPLSRQDKALVQEMVYGVCRWYLYLNRCYQPLLKKPVPKNYLYAHSLLAVGTYQLMFMRTAKHAAINETVEACIALDMAPLKGLINAILRKFSQAPTQLPDDAARLSHPAWMREKLTHNWPAQAEQIFIENNQRPPMTLRVNQQKQTRNEYLATLNTHNIEAHACQFAPQGLHLTQPVPVDMLPDFRDGSCSVQDEAAQLCVSLLDLTPGQRVLDACAAPGGKTCAILEAQEDIDLLALDNDARRAERITENLERLHLKAALAIAPAEEIEQWWDGKPFDRILLDVPCSATGVIRRHPDIKHLRHQNDLIALASTQLKILQQVWKTLASGGKLLYATCSVFPQENHRIIERFLKQQPDAKYLETDADWGIETGYGRQLFPTKQGHDGFFYACLGKSIEC
ncbi:MAG: 16S rRNA (cytosine(967)-C(5))-methyltransferase RsmB [Oleiphilus sp.]|nr:MAG: 16S rRNA (cytosine(967)-C(5))-methyltransferase RsmB [Oleiphilus sp.]